MGFDSGDARDLVEMDGGLPASRSPMSTSPPPSENYLGLFVTTQYVHSDAALQPSVCPEISSRYSERYVSKVSVRVEHHAQVIRDQGKAEKKSRTNHGRDKPGSRSGVFLL
jgi:hypothetical protein